MEITVERAADHVVCRPAGELEAHNVGDARTAFGALTADHLVIIDLSEVTFVDSAGIGCLIGAIRRVREAGGDVGVVSTRGQLNRILETTGFTRIVPVEGSVDDALAAMRRIR